MNKLFVNLTRGRGLMFAAAPGSEAHVYFSIGFGFPGYYGYNPGYYYPYRYYYRPYAATTISNITGTVGTDIIATIILTIITGTNLRR